MQKVDKEFVTKRFENSLKDYNSSATVQKAMATRLVAEITALNRSFSKVFEIGCGTGALTKEIFEKLNFNELLCNDLCADSYEFVKPFCVDNFSAFDAECTDTYPEQLDLIVSGAVFQWFDNLPGYLKKVSEKLRKNGVIAFSTFGTGQYTEIRQITGNCLNYFEKEDLINKIENNYEVIVFSQWTEILKFKSMKEIMSHIKATGVSGVKSDSSKRMHLTEFRKKYREKFLKNGELPLTYNPQIWILRRKG